MASGGGRLLIGAVSDGAHPNGASSIYLCKDGYWHGRVTVAVKDDVRPDRRHVISTQADVTRKVRAVERQRDGGTTRSRTPGLPIGEHPAFGLVGGGSGGI